MFCVVVNALYEWKFLVTFKRHRRINILVSLFIPAIPSHWQVPLTLHDEEVVRHGPRPQAERSAVRLELDPSRLQLHMLHLACLTREGASLLQPQGPATPVAANRQEQGTPIITVLATRTTLH